MRKTLFVGDVNVDLIFADLQGKIQPDREILAHEYSRTVGSSAVIAASAYARLGGSAGFCGLAGDDADGRFMVNSMNRLGIDTGLVDWHPTVPTGITLNLIEGRMRSQITYPGTIAHFDGSKLSPEHLKNWNHVHFSGIFQQDSFRPRLLDVLRMCRASMLTTSIDTQWDNTENWDGLNEWLEFINILFVNEDEAVSISGSEDVRGALESLASDETEVVIKTGPDGVLGASGNRREAAPSPYVPVKDSTGAGDTFAAAYIRSRIDGGQNFRSALAYAAAAGACACRYAGGVDSALSDEAVTALLQSDSAAEQ